MATETKFTEEEIKSLSELSQKYQTTQSAFGQIRVQRILLNQQEKNLNILQLIIFLTEKN